MVAIQSHTIHVQPLFSIGISWIYVIPIRHMKKNWQYVRRYFYMYGQTPATYKHFSYMDTITYTCLPTSWYSNWDYILTSRYLPTSKQADNCFFAIHNYKQATYHYEQACLCSSADTYQFIAHMYWCGEASSEEEEGSIHDWGQVA